VPLRPSSSDLFNPATQEWAAAREDWDEKNKDWFKTLLSRLRDDHKIGELQIIWGNTGQVAGVAAYGRRRSRFDTEAGSILDATAAMLLRLDADRAQDG
jgi:hypothetical protein